MNREGDAMRGRCYGRGPSPWLDWVKGAGTGHRVSLFYPNTISRSKESTKIAPYLIPYVINRAQKLPALGVLPGLSAIYRIAAARGGGAYG